MPALSPDGLTIEHLASWQGLMDHYDVAASPAIADGDVLAWDAGSGMFVATAQTGGGGTLAGLTDTAISSPVIHETLRFDGADWVNTSVLLTTTTGISVGGTISANPGITIDRTAAEPYIIFAVSGTNEAQVRGYSTGVKITNAGAGTTWLDVTAAAVSALGYLETTGAAGASTLTSARLYDTQLRFMQFSGDENNAGVLDYRGFDSTALSVVGAGTSSTNRLVRVFDHLAIGTNPLTDRALTLVPSGSADAYLYGITSMPVQTGATSSGVGPIAGYFRADVNAPALTVDRTFGVFIETPTVTAGTLTSAFGIYIQSITTGGTNNYALWTNAGLVRIGGQIESAVTTGTAPFIIASTTVVTNLNADLLDGNHASAFASSTHVHDAGDITTGTFADARIAQSNVTQHQAALSITEGQIANGSIYARLADAENISGAWIFQNAAGAKVQHGTEAQWRMEKTGASANLSYFFNNGVTLGLFDSTNTRTPWHYTISGNTLTITSPLTTPVQITSTLATGTAPFSIASTTVVTNLNADTVDGQHASAFALSGHVHDAGTDITTGTLDEQRGGTGNNAYVTGDILYASSAFVLARLAKGTSGMFLKQGASIPAWASITAADVDSGTFPGSSGYTFTSVVITNASAAGGAGFRLPHGAAPSAPTNGDLWSTTTGLFFRQNGSTVTLATSANAVITNPSAVQTIVAASTASTSYALELQGFGSSGAFQNNDSPPYVMRGYYWDGAASQPIAWSVAAIITGAPTPTNTLTFKADGTARFTVTDAGKGWLGGPWIVGSDDGPPVGVNTQELVAHDNTRQIGIGVDTTRGLVGMRSNHEFAFMTNNTRRWTVAAAGGMEVVADDSYDIGTTTFRVREIFTHDLRLGGPSSDVGLIYHSGEFDNGTSGAGAKTIDWTNGNVQKITATGTATISFTAPDGPTTLVLRIIANSTTAYTFTWPSTVKWAGGVSAPASPTTSGQWIMVTFYYDGTNYTASYTGNTG